jgi:2'-5' RNA ligase
MTIILETLEAWQRERAPLVNGAAIVDMAKLVNLDERMRAQLEALGFPHDGYTIPPAIALVRSADRAVLPILTQWREERAKLDAEEMALPSSAERYPHAKTKHALDVRVLEKLEALGCPAWGLQIDAAIAIIEAVCAEREVPN